MKSVFKVSIYGRPNQLIIYKVQQRSSTRNYRERNPIELQYAGVILDPSDFKSSAVRHSSMPPRKKEGSVALKQSCRLRSIHGHSRIFPTDVRIIPCGLLACEYFAHSSHPTY